MQADLVAKLLDSRRSLPAGPIPKWKAAEEGGCGVTGFIASIPVSGKHIFEPSVQMHNRGNGKGGGIAAVGLHPDDLGVDQEVLDSHYLLQVALLDPGCRQEVEEAYIRPFLQVYKGGPIATVGDYRQVEGLEVRPPDVWRYLVRVKANVLARFVEENGLEGLDPRRAEDEFIYQNSYRLNQSFYASLGDKKAFVLSHGRNIMILKIVGYAEQVAQYYKLEDFRAHGWIAHQRYPTKGRVWHPGGAHPFTGLDEALVHNGDFANYHAVCEYLRQHHIYPQFLTDTEVSILLFDLWSRVFGYPLEYIIEAMAPTTEHDFDQLPAEKQRIYRIIQAAHIHGSPDGPWFFIIARNDPYNRCQQLIGITDTAMLRPQVFALQEGEVQIGLICSEKQAIDATLQSLAKEDSRFCPIADLYWNARGGSASDGGAFIFTVRSRTNGDGMELVCTNKFGEEVRTPPGQRHLRPVELSSPPPEAAVIAAAVETGLAGDDLAELQEYWRANIESWSYAACGHFVHQVTRIAQRDEYARERAIRILTFLNDRRYPTGIKKRSSLLQIIRQGLAAVFSGVPLLAQGSGGRFRRLDWQSRHGLRPPREEEEVLVVNARGFPPEGEECDARLLCRAYEMGWTQFICYGYHGQRFCGCGFGKDSHRVRIDVYDSSGDYLGSGIDGLEIHVHGNGQDQLGQIMKSGKMVIHGDVGQTFLYGAKGGEVYVLGNAAGRPLINAVGRPRVVINGTCLDYLAESFMAGEPLNGGGFVVLNGIQFDDRGRVVDQATPYPGSNLFSLASGGAIYVRDPHRQVVAEQLNGGELVELTPADWELILPYLKENERLFGIRVEEDLLRVDGRRLPYQRVYRKVQAVALEVLAKESTAAEEWGEDWQEGMAQT